jgi:hypothetical protein
MAYEVDLKDTFPARLEAKLRSAGIDVQVLNFSVSGFGTAEMLRTYEGFGRNFSPDIVVFGWNSSDLADNVRSDLYRLKDGQLVASSPTYLPSIDVQNFLMRSAIYRWIADNSHLYSLVRERAGLATKRLLTRIRQLRLPFSFTAATGDSREQTKRYSAAVATALLQASKREVEKDGRGFVLVDIPNRLSRTSFSSSFDPMAGDLRGLTVVRPLDAFRAAARPDRKLYYERGEGHLTPRGVDIVASLTADALVKSPKLANCPMR